jgi:hypothetical protein
LFFKYGSTNSLRRPVEDRCIPLLKLIGDLGQQLPADGECRPAGEEEADGSVRAAETAESGHSTEVCRSNESKTGLLFL